MLSNGCWKLSLIEFLIGVDTDEFSIEISGFLREYGKLAIFLILIQLCLQYIYIIYIYIYTVLLNA